MFELNLANHFIIIFNDTCPESPPLQWSNGISSLGSHPSSNSFNLMAHGGALSLDSSQNSPVPTLPLGADYTNHYHYSSGITSSQNSPGSVPSNTVTQLPCDIDRHSSPTTGDSFTVDYGYLHQLQATHHHCFSSQTIMTTQLFTWDKSATPTCLLSPWTLSKPHQSRHAYRCGCRMHLQ